LLVGELDDMSAVVEDLLTTSRLDAGALEYAIEPVQVREEIRSLLETLNHRGASVYMAMDDGVVNADRRRLRQIVRNLLANGLKYGGPNIEIKGQSDADSYTIVVVDDGHGVPPGIEEKLFTRFASDGDGAQNVGLGLSIVMALAVGMGGTAFHQREDGLTRFGVRLPNAEAVSARADDAAKVPVPQAAG
jgi:signal transduction histidine kinase